MAKGCMYDRLRFTIEELKNRLAVVEKRLEVRRAGVNADDQSSADWGVYQRMKRSWQHIRRSHFAVDTSRDISPVIDKILRQVRR